jgi:hypothetical protein
MGVAPDPRFAHSAGSGDSTPNDEDAVETRDDDAGAHTSTRTTDEGVERRPQDDAPDVDARLLTPPHDLENRAV